MIGYDFFAFSGFLWRRHQGALIPLTMPHALPKRKFDQARRLLMSHRAPFVRWEEDFDQLDSSDWWHVIKDEVEDLSLLSKNTRSKIRRGAKRFCVAPLGVECVTNEGYPVYCSAFLRYETFEERLSQDAFERSINALPKETEFWGVRERDTNRLVAFSENLVRDGACFYNTMWFDPEGLKAYAGYILLHEMNKHYLNERGLQYVSDGARSISHKTRIHEFLERKFGFRKAYANLRVVYFPGVGIVVGLLFPFRRWFEKGSSSDLAKKIGVVLEQERIRRSCLQGKAR